MPPGAIPAAGAEKERGRKSLSLRAGAAIRSPFDQPAFQKKAFRQNRNRDFFSPVFLFIIRIVIKGGIVPFLKIR